MSMSIRKMRGIQIWHPYHPLHCINIDGFRKLILFSQKSNKVKKYSKKEILWHGVLICVVVDRKNDKLEFWQIFQKNASQKGLSSIDMYNFRVKWPSYGHSHAIVCDKLPIFGTYVYLGMGNKGLSLSI